MKDREPDAAAINDRRHGLTDADFERLKRERDSAIANLTAEICKAEGWPLDKVHVHISGAGGCYCACPGGPCQHEFEGWREFDDGRGGETVCKHCGLGCMAHDMRFAP